MKPNILRSINEALVLFGHGVRPEEIAAVGGVDESDVRDALEQLAQQGLVEDRGEFGWFSLAPGLGTKPLILASRQL